MANIPKRVEGSLMVRNDFLFAHVDEKDDGTLCKMIMRARKVGCVQGPTALYRTRSICSDERTTSGNDAG